MQERNQIILHCGHAHGCTYNVWSYLRRCEFWNL